MRKRRAGRVWLDRLVFFTWWVRAQRSVETWPRGRRIGLLAAAAGLGSAARLWAQTLPPNWDFGQWVNVSNAALAGQDPYVAFGYNYTPVWLVILTAFNAVTADEATFRLLICAFLLVVDLWIAWMLARRGYSLAAAVFLLSPITIAISGQHQQIDGLAVALALAALLLMGRGTPGRITRIDIAAVLVLGASLSVKQVFLVLPLWLAMRPGAWQRRLLYLLAPPAVFALALSTGFVRYSPTAVVDAVLTHASGDNSPLVLAFVPHQLAPWVIEQGGGKVLSLLLLVPAGLLFRRLRPFEAGLAYGVTALLFAWAVANQYLVIPMAAVAVFLNLGYLAWLALASLYLGGSPGVLNIPVLNAVHPNVFLEWQWMGRDLFPFLLAGWILMVLGLRDPDRHLAPSASAIAREDRLPGPRAGAG